MKINDKQKRFIEEYLISGNGTQSYMKAYPSATKRTAQENSFKLLNNTDIIQVIKMRQKETEEEFNISKSELVRLLLSIAQDDDAKDNDKISSINSIAKMLGYNAVEKKEVEHKGGIIWNEEKTYD